MALTSSGTQAAGQSIEIQTVKGGFPAEAVVVDEFAPKLDVTQMNYTEHFFWKILAGSR
jgi:hypothetical protein